MKVGLVCPYNLAKGGGVQECVLAIQAELRKRGHEVKVLTPTPRQKSAQSEKDIIFIGLAADVKSPFHTTAQISVSLDNEAIDKVLAAEQFDLLHFHEPWVPMVSMQILARSSSINLATFHAKLPDTVMSRTIEKVITPYTRSIMKYLHGLTAVSEAAAQYVKSITDKPVTIIPNGIDLSVYQEAGNAPKSNKTILFVGRLERRKGVIHLLKAFKLVLVTDPEAHLIIAGDGPDRKKLEAFVRDEKIPHITFEGYVTQAQKFKLLSEASLFVSPALFGESFGIVLLEAMAADIPIVAGNNPGYTSVLKEIGEISIVNPKDSKEFARRMSILLTNNQLRALWQGWAREYVKQFSYPVVVDQYEQLYQQLTTRQH